MLSHDPHTCVCLYQDEEGWTVRIPAKPIQEDSYCMGYSFSIRQDGFHVPFRNKAAAEWFLRRYLEGPGSDNVTAKFVNDNSWFSMWVSR